MWLSLFLVLTVLLLFCFQMRYSNHHLKAVYANMLYILANTRLIKGVVLPGLFLVLVKERAAPQRRYTGFDLICLLDEAAITSSHIEKGETRIFQRKTHTGSAGFKPGTHA